MQALLNHGQSEIAFISAEDKMISGFFLNVALHVLKRIHSRTHLDGCSALKHGTKNAGQTQGEGAGATCPRPHRQQPGGSTVSLGHWQALKPIQSHSFGGLDLGLRQRLETYRLANVILPPVIFHFGKKPLEM